MFAFAHLEATRVMTETAEGESRPAPAPTIFGPVPSRRLGRSLGIGNVPVKTCSYSCVYCQVGPTPATEIEPRRFWPPGAVVDAVTRHVRKLRERGEGIDYLTFVPDGEPTLDRDLGEEIDELRALEIPIAVISNGSLTFREDVRAALSKADWVSLKVDAADETTWRKVNRPFASLDMPTVLEGMLQFAAEFRGELATETMLVQGLNDGEAAIESVAAFLERLRPAIAYIAAPIRPPAEPWVRPADEETFNRAFQRFAERLPRVELITGFEGTAFGATGDVVQDLLSITAVHPMREDAALALLSKSQADRGALDRLVAENRLKRVTYRDRVFYVRRFA
jgi:wyosine [tRNA(Phe)-imidazoG37] synthetase (radical SAM superfamily)